MKELSPEFLSAIAQVSATFIGFALLTPVFQAVASGRKIPERIYIRQERFLMKWFVLLLLPIFVLGYPLIASLLLLMFYAKFDNIPAFMEPLCIPLSIVFGFSIILIYLWAGRWSKLTRWKGGSISKEEDLNQKIPAFLLRTIEVLPPFLVIVCLLMWSGLFGNLKWILVCLIISGLLFIIRNVGVEIDKGILFNGPEISSKFEKTKDEFKSRVDEAIKRRKKVIDEMARLLNRIKEKGELKELKRSIGYQEGEIQNLQRLLGNEGEGIEDLYEKLSRKDEVVLKDFTEFEGRRIDGERRIEEFKAGTVVALNVLRRKYPENEYGVKWQDESD